MRFNLVFPADLAEIIRVEAVRRRVRPRDIAVERLRESYRRKPAPVSA